MEHGDVDRERRPLTLARQPPHAFEGQLDLANAPRERHLQRRDRTAADDAIHLQPVPFLEARYACDQGRVVHAVTRRQRAWRNVAERDQAGVEGAGASKGISGMDCTIVQGRQGRHGRIGRERAIPAQGGPQRVVLT